MTARHHLTVEYRRTFEHYSETARKVRQLATEPGSRAEDVEAAILSLEIARADYVCTRNALAGQLMPALARVIARTAAESRPVREARVRTLAQLLWEAGGRRDGNAAADWHRAEEIVGRAIQSQIDHPCDMV